MKIKKCSFCGKLPRMMVCRVPELKEIEYKLSHMCEYYIFSNCGNWYEKPKMAILDWNMNRSKAKQKILPRRDNYILRNYDKYYSNGELRGNE